jgi:phosphoglycerate dehydrogenase-like enzyme
LRSLHGVDRAMHGKHDWVAASAFGLGRTIAGTRIGVVGASRVGRIYIELVRAAGAEVVVHNPYFSEEAARELGVRLAGLDELLRTSPVVALHAPVTDEIRGMLRAERLALIPDPGEVIGPLGYGAGEQRAPLAGGGVRHRVAAAQHHGQ